MKREISESATERITGKKDRPRDRNKSYPSLY